MGSRLVKSLVLLGFGFLFLSAQQPEKAKDDAKATVYIYRYKQFQGSGLSPSVYCDDTELARMENGRFLVAKFVPGKHAFRSNDKQSGIDLDMKAGEEYYIRVEIATGFMKGHGRLVSSAPEQGAYEIKKLKPLSADKVKDAEHVVPSSGEGN
jgi:hypothetical protein